uniref:Uncharacterized protein n=1 Tax=Trichinella nativa TaxID=6335 RepID=A0A0V1KJ26_9BILA
MAKNTEKRGNEKCTLYDLEYLKKVQNEKFTLFDLEYGKKPLKNVENEKCTL